MKVLLLKLFSGQVILRIREEPVCVCSGGGGQLVLVATRSGWIELHEVHRGDGPFSHTVGRFGVASRAEGGCVESMAVVDVLEGGLLFVIAVLERTAGGKSLRIYRFRRGTMSISSTSEEVPEGIAAFSDEEAARNLVCSFDMAVDEFAVCDAGSKRILVGNANGLWILQFDGTALVTLAELAICRPTKLALSGPFVGFCQSDLMHAFVLRVVVAAAAAAASSVVESGHLDGGTDEAKEWVFVGEDGGDATQGIGLPLSIPSLEEAPYVVLGPRENVDVSVSVESGYVLLENKSLVATFQPDSSLHSLHICCSTRRAALVTADGAKLFSLEPPVCLLAEYLFTSPTCFSMMDEAFLYVIQQRSTSKNATSPCLETYTLRPDLRRMIRNLDLPPPCLVTSLPFIGLQRVIPLGHQSGVAIMSKQVTEADAFWNVSVLTPERTMDVWRELVVMAGPADDIYLLLHLEGLFLLDARKDDHTPDGCRLVGDFYEGMGNFSAAVAFWGMGKVPVDEVTRRLIHQRQANVALVEFFLSAVARLDPRLQSVGVGIGNALIEHLAKHRVSELPHALLTCSFAHDPILALGLLNRSDSYLERFARGHCFALVGDTNACTMVVKSVGPDRLVELLQKYELTWHRDGVLTLFGECIRNVSGLSVLEAAKRKPIDQVHSMLGAHHLPYFIMYLEWRIISSLNHAAAAEVDAVLSEAIPMLAHRYIERCKGANPESMEYPFGVVDGRFLVDMEETPVETRWTVRHWHWMCSARLPWMRPNPAFYVAKLQGLLVMMRSSFPALAAQLHAEAASLPRVVLEGCSLLWSPSFSKEHNTALLSQPQEVIVGYCKEFCGSDLESWKRALDSIRVENQMSTYGELLAHVLDLFTLEEFLRLLPPGAPISFYVPFLWRKLNKDSCSALLGGMSTYVDAAKDK